VATWSKTSDWVTPSSVRRPVTSSGNSGVDDDCEAKYEEPDNFFGPVEITDEVFDGMFNNSKKVFSKPVASFLNTRSLTSQKLQKKSS